MNKKMGLTILMGLAFLAIAAQKSNHQFDYEKFKSQKIAFITEKLNLSPREAQEFWPVYNEYEKQRMTLQQNRRSLEEKTRDESIKMTDQEIIKNTRNYAATIKQEAELTETYNEKFLQILPPQKVLLLYRAEGQFRAHMFEQYRKQRQN